MVDMFWYNSGAPTDLNEVRHFAVGSLPENTTNAPTTSYLYFLCFRISKQEQYIQICFSYWQTTSMYVRFLNSGTWGAWCRYGGTEL